MKGQLNGLGTQLAAMVEKYPDATLSEYCEYWGTTYNQWVSTSTICRALKKSKLTLKKKTLGKLKIEQLKIEQLKIENYFIFHSAMRTAYTQFVISHFHSQIQMPK